MLVAAAVAVLTIQRAASMLAGALMLVALAPESPVRTVRATTDVES